MPANAYNMPAGEERDLWVAGPRSPWRRLERVRCLGIAQETRRNLPGSIGSTWLVGVPGLVIILLVRGWGETFRTGEAFLYLAGLAAAAMGENLLQLREEGFFIKKAARPPGTRRLRIERAFSYLLAVGAS